MTKPVEPMLRSLSRSFAAAVLAGVAAACGLPDDTIDLLPGSGGSSSTGATVASTSATTGTASGGHAGAGGSGGNGCTRNVECHPPTPMCEPASGECVACPPELTTCGGECVDTQRDPDHCGGCFQGCLHNQLCHDSQCHCLPPLQPCNGSCVDFGSDPDHCGSCSGAGSTCLALESCDGGHCTTAGCSAGLTACPAPSNRTACVNLGLGWPRCASCDLTCGPNEVCAAGACREYLPATPCSACPCDGICPPALAEPVTCCSTVFGVSFVACVAGAACP